MRITNKVLTDNFLRNMNNNLSRMNVLQDQLSTGKRINAPSDDPASLTTSLRLRSKLHEIEQFKENANEAYSWLERTDSALDSINFALQRTRELTIEGSSCSNSTSSLDSIANEIDQINEELADIANTKLGDKYIFGGTQTLEKVYDGGVWNGNSQEIRFEIGEGINTKININGRTVFGIDPDLTKSTFGTLDSISQALRDGKVEELSENLLNDLDQHLDVLLAFRAETGARLNRLEMVENRLDDTEINYSNILSKNEDVDMADLIIKLKNEENVYNASLSAGARIIQPTLVDFLK